MALGKHYDWGIHNLVTKYAADTSQSETVRRGDLTIGPIDPDTFATKLYWEAPEGKFISRLQSALLEGGPIICIVGHRGSGKTSALYRVKHNIEASHTPPHHVAIINVKPLLDTADLQGLTEMNAANKFRSALRKQLLAQFFPRHQHDFYAWAIAGPPDSSDPFESLLLGELVDFEEPDAELYKLPRNQRVESIMNKFRKDSGEFEVVRDKVSPQLRPAHVIQAALTLRYDKRLILIFDNIDQIPNNLQGIFFEVAETAHSSLGRACTIAISIRHENVLSVSSRQGGDSDELSIFSDELSIFLEQDRSYPGFVLPENDYSHYGGIIDKRYQFIGDQHQEKYEPHCAETERDEEPSTLGDSHKLVVERIGEVNLHLIANHSTHRVLTIYSDFLRYFRSLKHQINLARLHSTERQHADTLFFMWLFVRGPDHGIVMHDVLLLGKAPAEIPRLASVHHLLLTCVLNFQLELPIAPGGQASGPSVHLVVKRMGTLGFGFDDVKHAMQELCASPGGEARSIEFIDDEPDVKHLKADDEYKMRLTASGEELVANLYNRIGYVWGRAYEHHWASRDVGAGVRASSASRQPPQSRQGMPLKTYFDKSVKERIRILLEYLVATAKQHLVLLGKVQRKWIDEEIATPDRWLSQYRRQFGVNKTLQLERILDSGAKFYRPYYSDDENPFNMLKLKYAALLSTMEEQGTADGLDYSELSEVLERI